MSKKETSNFMDFSVLNKYNQEISAIDMGQSQRFNVNRQQIKQALDGNDVVQLRKFSQYFYQTSGAYKQLVDYLGTLLTFDHVLVPRLDEEQYESTGFKRAYKNVKKYLAKSTIKQDSSDMVRKMVRDGCYFGYERELNGTYSFQHLPAGFCRSRFKIMGVYAVEFDYSYFRQFAGKEIQEVIEAFPAEMQAGYQEYLNNAQENRWQLLNPTYARAHMLEQAAPPLSAVFLDLLDYEAAKDKAKIKESLDIYKLIVQKINLDDEGKLTFQLPEIKQFHENLRKAVKNSNIDVVTTPFSVEGLDIQDKFQNNKDNVERAKDTIYSTAGTSAILFNAGAQANSRAIEESIKTDESILLPLLHQFEKWYKNRLAAIAPRFEFELHFPPITQRNRKNMFEMYSQAASYGYPTKLLALASMGLAQDNAEYLLRYENDYLGLAEKMIPTQSAHTSSGSDKGGAPTKDTDELSEEGVKTRDKGGSSQ